MTGHLIGLLLDRLRRTPEPTDEHADAAETNRTMPDEPNENTDNDAVESDEDNGPEFRNATVTTADGHTFQTTDFASFNIRVDGDMDDVDVNEVSAGLVDGDREHEVQLTLEVPTKTLVCVNCDHPNEVPIWNFTRVKFSGDLEHLSGDYAVGHQCEQCGFPY